MDQETRNAAEDCPPEIQDRLNEFDEALTKIETCVNPLLSTPLSEVHEKLSPLDKAKIDLISAYTINSLFWMYLNVKGINPKEHRVRQELGSIQQYMGRAKQIQDKALAPKIDLPSTKRFIKNALWAQAKKDAAARKESEESSLSATESIDAKAAKKALWKAAHKQARQLAEEPASTGPSSSELESSPPKRKRKDNGKQGKKRR